MYIIYIVFYFALLQCVRIKCVTKETDLFWAELLQFVLKVPLYLGPKSALRLRSDRGGSVLKCSFTDEHAVSLNPSDLIEDTTFYMHWKK